VKRFRPILLALLYTCLLLAGYSAMLRFFKISVDCAENVDTLRRIIGERIVFTTEKTEMVVVGSSLTALLPNSYYRDGRVNLSIPGGSSNLGLEILARSRFLPKVLVVETNTLFIDADPKFVNGLFQEPQLTLKRHFPIFQTQYRPINVVLSLANQLLIGDQAKNNIDAVDPAVLERALSGQRKLFATVPKEPEFSHIVQRFEQLIREFQGKGTKILFLEMPVHPELVNSPREKYIRDKLTDLFPKEKYQWLTPAGERAYEVTDGMHLLHREGVAVNGLIDGMIATGKSGG